MLFDMKLVHFVYRNEDGTIHVQNAVGHMFGQHHVHDATDFDKWKPLGELIECEGGCSCDVVQKEKTK